MTRQLGHGLGSDEHEFGVRRIGFMGMSQVDQVVLAGQMLTDVDFSGRRLFQFSAEGSRLERCRFDGAVIQSASFGSGHQTSEYVGCSFDDATLHMTPDGSARFVDCSFENTSIANWLCFEVELVDCVFSGRLKKVVFNGTVPEDSLGDAGRRTNEFEGNDFSRAELIEVAFRTGIDLTKQRLPTGDEYVYLADAAAALRRARAAYNAWEDPELKKRARALLIVLEGEVAAGQRQLLVRADDFPGANRLAIRALMAEALKVWAP